MSDTAKALIVIPLLALFCGVLVLGAYSQIGTRPDSAAKAFILHEIRQIAAPDAVIIETENDRIGTGRFWRVEIDGALVMASFIVTSHGFHGPVTALATLDTTGQLIDLLLLSQHEHPALTGKGSVKSGIFSFLKSITDKPAQCMPDPQLSAVTGATVTKKALGPDLYASAGTSLRIVTGKTTGR